MNHPLLVTLLENIKTLYNVSGELVAGIKNNPDNITEVFHKLAPFFKLYSIYAYDYTQVLNLLQVIIEYRKDLLSISIYSNLMQFILYRFAHIYTYIFFLNIYVLILNIFN